MWNLTSFWLEIVLVSVQDSPNVPSAQKSFWMHSMVPLGDEAQVEARFGLSNIVLILAQDRCTVFVERTTGLEILLDVPDGTPR